jgi:hypothetical protein
MGLCALVLSATPAAAQAGASTGLGDQLARHIAAMQKSTSVIHFFDTHRWLLRDPRFQKEAKLRLRIAKRKLAASSARAKRAHVRLARERARVEHRQLVAELRGSPEKAICHVFGSYCSQALRVAWCESGYSVDAQNGQYLGLFQMGTNERRIFGHGADALVQARAAYRYFVHSGRDWSPWSCKPWY